MKIGRSKNPPHERVRTQSRQNGEEYKIVQSFYTLFHMHLEWSLHWLLRRYRVVRPDLEDGKTEWFIIGIKELVRSVWKVRKAMHIMFKDVEPAFYPEPAKKPETSAVKKPAKKKSVAVKVAPAVEVEVTVLKMGRDGGKEPEKERLEGAKVD